MIGDRPAIALSPPLRHGAGAHAGQQAVVVALGFVSAGNADAIDLFELKRQQVSIAQACVRRGWVLVDVVRDVEPARRTGCRRPALDYALRRLGDGQASRLVVPRLESLCHSVAEIGPILDHLDRRRAGLLCLEPEIDTRSEPGATIVKALVGVSRRERQRLGERTRKGLMTARDKRASARPAVADSPELKERIVGMRAQGMTLQAIADVLNAEGVPTVRGGSCWRPSSVHAATGYKRRDNGDDRWR